MGEGDWYIVVICMPTKSIPLFLLSDSPQGLDLENLLLKISRLIKQGHGLLGGKLSIHLIQVVVLK